MVCLSSEDLKSEEGYSLQIETLCRSDEHVKAAKWALLVQLENGYEFWLRATQLYFVSVASLTIRAAAGSRPPGEPFLFLSGFALFGGFRCPVFFQFPLVLIFHGNSMTQSDRERRGA